MTTGVEYFTKAVKINEKTNIKMQIWDTVMLFMTQVGQEIFKSLVRSFYKGVSGILLMYSIEKQESFQQLADWIK